MARKIVEQNDHNILYHHTGMTAYTGCQCYGDCGCSDSFKPAPYNYYTVKRIGKKVTTHGTLEDALIRWEFVQSLIK